VNEEGVNSLESHEAHIGTLVGVLDGAKRTDKGRVGTIERTYGHPDYLAMDVRFADGSVELYWYHELRRMEGVALNVKRLADGSSGVCAVVVV
jgi:hypothetical protein